MDISRILNKYHSLYGISLHLIIIQVKSFHFGYEYSQDFYAKLFDLGWIADHQFEHSGHQYTPTISN